MYIQITYYDEWDRKHYSSPKKVIRVEKGERSEMVRVGVDDWEKEPTTYPIYVIEKDGKEVRIHADRYDYPVRIL